MAGLVDGLLDVSRVTRGLITLDRQALDMADIINDAVEQARPLIERHRHQLALRLPPGSVLVEGDRKRLVQVMANLLSNAAKYTPDGGRIVLDMEVDARQVGVRVSDNGIGMDSAMLAQAFDLFTQAKRSHDRSQGGLGIGLALVRSLVELHGGSVRAESDGIGHGCRFIVAVPRSKAAPSQ
ncbi:Histidine kinase-, DNA gyrase B-, and HSP90-like ATPase [Noviherbaspirillum humi]|uniref:histidine kinase n=1 Tax=Noviherbaspirillum humi TaxID=1688639 RepID=A0A239FE96_9BURK|nr:HAMP domain-containing sensor histidine kinase [Noviherbaspirillum humi]SNS54838.1 Histidine kinase-, DNA gyrase B-, and HSP90-like ATPase [Noviherbaspirillum humi]